MSEYSTGVRIPDLDFGESPIDVIERKADRSWLGLAPIRHRMDLAVGRNKKGHALVVPEPINEGCLIPFRRYTSSL
jgi:hypothetical protein